MQAVCCSGHLAQKESQKLSLLFSASVTSSTRNCSMTKVSRGMFFHNSISIKLTGHLIYFYSGFSFFSIGNKAL